MEADLVNIVYKRVSALQPVSDYINETIRRRLEAGQRVAWLVPGGSAIDVALAAGESLASAPHLENLNISLTDERYGPRGHSDSNWRQLADRGFKLPKAKLFPVLNGENLPNTSRRYSQLIRELLEVCDYSLVLTGMGTDGHILGIKPHSPAVSSQQAVTGYESGDYTRLTITPKYLEQIDEIILYVRGHEKHDQLDKLERDVGPDEQPAQFLKKMKKVIIFNDYKGGPA